ncbi:MAG: hypothetical protein ACREC0_11020 [Methylocella sp.]
MSRGDPKSKELKPSDRRSWPAAGDRSTNKLYAAVGRGLSQWEHHEGALSILFAAFITNSESLAARRSYVAVRTFEGRAEMLRAASLAYFAQHPHEAYQVEFKSILGSALQFSQRRNDIAHGVIDYFMENPAGWGETLANLSDRQFLRKMARFPKDAFALYPSWASFRERDLNQIPTYCMSSKELDYFADAFANLCDPPRKLAEDLIVRRRRRKR